MRANDKISLLIVEDDATIRFLEEAAAQRSGVFSRITTLGDGEAALAWLKVQPLHELPQLIISDLAMPRLSGIGLARALKADGDFQDIPLAIITSSDAPNDREDALAAGAFEFRSKPMRFDDFVRVMTEIRQHATALQAEAPPSSRGA